MRTLILLEYYINCLCWITPFWYIVLSNFTAFIAAWILLASCFFYFLIAPLLPFIGCLSSGILLHNVHISPSDKAEIPFPKNTMDTCSLLSPLLSTNVKVESALWFKGSEEWSTSFHAYAGRNLACRGTRHHSIWPGQTLV